MIDGQSETVRALTLSLVAGTLALADWQVQMMAAIKASHLVATAVAVGGWQQMDQEWFGWAGSQIKPQYQWLMRFSVEISSGKQKLDGTAAARAQMYAEAARATHRAAEQRIALRQGMAQEKNVLGQADHCVGCLKETRRGWQAIGNLVPCGERNCLTRCHCHLIYRVQAA